LETALISVIVPIYKTEQYLKKCVDSITNQSYKNLQIILVDDGSPDKSGGICDEYASSDSRVKVIHQKNRGLSTAYNVGLDNASGEYIAFVDSDDWIDSDFCSVLVDLLEKNNADISACAFFPFLGSEQKSSVKENLTIYTGLEVIEKVRISPCGKIYKRELFEGLRFPSDRHPGDVFFTYKVLYRAKKAVVTNLQFFNYLRREDGVTGLVPKAENLHVMEAFWEKIRFLEEKGHGIHAAKSKKQLAATLSGFKAYFKKHPENDNGKAADFVDKQLAAAAAECMADRHLSFIQKAQVMLYKNVPEAAFMLSGLKKKLRGR
jgi:glycosyltransferase involved in cell wall biosynthesis